MNTIKQTRLAGLLYLSGVLAGILSVAPAADAIDHLTAADANSHQIMMAALFQVLMSLAHMGMAILLYPSIRRYGSSLTTGFLSFRIIAVVLSVAGAMLLLAILSLSRAYVSHPSGALAVWGDLLRTSRDQVNHVFMIFFLCLSNCLLYILFYRFKLVPRWLSVWGMAGACLSVGASILFLFQKVPLTSGAYLGLNAPAALQELVLGCWLMIKGISPRSHFNP